VPDSSRGHANALTAESSKAVRVEASRPPATEPIGTSPGGDAWTVLVEVHT
jgi:hypothetical protein